MTALATHTARGVLFVHSAPRALCPHIEWAAGRALERAVNFDWDQQPVLPGSQRTEFYWEGPRGTGAKLASALPKVVSSSPVSNRLKFFNSRPPLRPYMDKTNQSINDNCEL